MLQVVKGFDWLSCLIFDNDDTLIAGFHAVSSSVSFVLIFTPFVFIALKT